LKWEAAEWEVQELLLHETFCSLIAVVLRDTSEAMESISPFASLTQGVNYSPPWQDLSIIGIAGCSGSGKTSVAMEIVKSLNLPWVVILSLV